MTQKRLPVHVLTGFLGSGKTTLLSALLREPTLQDTLVIVNEIGDVGLDHLLLTETPEEVIVQLDGGCACCVVRGDLVRTLSSAHQHSARDDSTRFARVVIETSGLATPDAIISTLMRDPRVAPLYRLGRIATVFDVVNGPRTLAAYGEARAQLAAAETIVLTKLDLSNGKGYEQAVAAINDINPSATVSSAERFLRDVPAWVRDPELTGPANIGDVRSFSSTDTTPFPHSENIATFTLRCRAPLQRQAFNEWVAVRLRFLHGRVLRIKGLVWLNDTPRPTFVHGVQQLFHPAQPLDAWPFSKPETLLVFITENISRRIIEQSFEAFVVARSTAETARGTAPAGAAGSSQP